MSSVYIISATRHDADSFMASAPLGRSLKRLSYDVRIAASIALTNTRGLPGVFNAKIVEENRSRILVFVHDDVWIEDYFLVDRLTHALQTFDLIGVVGNTRRLARQPNWLYVNERLEKDEPGYLSGAIGHGDDAMGQVSGFGPSPRVCRLLDGVFLAARCDVLLDRNVRFDERFTFDFYDMDLCRAAEQRGLRVGTWPIAITHASLGNIGVPSWSAALLRYLEKWTE